MQDIVLLHGWGSTAAVWAGLVPGLEGYRVSAPELPGYGTRAPGGPCTLEHMAAALAAAAPARCHVVGWSLGGQVALAWARRAPRQVTRLALIAATPCFTQRPGWPEGVCREEFARFSDALAADGAGTLKRFAALQAQGDADARGVARALRAALPQPGGPGAAALAGALRILLEADLRETARTVCAPALVLHGDRDAVVPPAAGERLSRLLPDGRFRLLAGAAHAPFLSQPGEVARALRAHFGARFDA